MVWTITAICIAAVGFIILIVKTINRKIESGFATTLFSTGLALIVESFGTLTDKIFGLLTDDAVTNNSVQLYAGFILIFLGLWMSLYIKNKLSILNLLGVKERRIEEHKEDLGLNQFEFKEREIDLSYYSKKGMNVERFNDATEMIKDKMESFYAENKELKKGYTGTASIPFTMYAGFCYKGSPTTEFFEYNRFDGGYSKLKKAKWWKKKSYPELSLLKSLDESNLSGFEEVVLGVSLTMPIQESQVEQFDAPFIHLTIDSPKQNAIEYEVQLQEYVKKIFDTIIELNQVASIQKIHLVLSSQSCLPFELGKQLTTDTYMKPVIIYHYVNDPTPHYSWGILFNHQGTELIEC